MGAMLAKRAQRDSKHVCSIILTAAWPNKFGHGTHRIILSATETNHDSFFLNFQFASIAIAVP
jgi:hypothetical protein